MSEELLTQLEPVKSSRDGRRNVLIVDDDQEQADTLAHCLQRQGFDATVTLEGQLGLDWAVRHHPDVVIMDICLPDADGLEVCEQLVDAPDTCDIPVIIVSGVEKPDIVRRSRTAGCRYFVHKPFDPNALLTLIETALQSDFDH